MKQTKSPAKLATLATLAVLAFPASIAHAQAAHPTATRQAQISVFGGLTGTYTDLEGGKNGGITAGADFTFLSLPHVRPALELRGTYPVKSGHIDSQKNFLIGPKVESQFGRFRPYANFLIGRGSIDYLNGGLLYNNVLYLRTNTTVYSPGVGVDFDLSTNWSAKADFQYQYWHIPATRAGSLHPKATTLGIVYRFTFNPRHHRSR
ncbi:MAG: outer membrane beta-barrel protein [Edaphobacter sp.]